jgi:hypothetical protein
MAKNKKPETPDTHSIHLGEMDEIVKFLLESCNPDMTGYQKFKQVSAKLKRMIHILGRNAGKSGIDVNTYGFICRLAAMQKGYFENSSVKKETSSETPHEFSDAAKLIIESLSDISGDHLPSDEMMDIAEEVFCDPSSLVETRKSLSEIFEISGDGIVRLREEALSAILEKIIEKTGEAIPEESRKAVESILESDHPFSGLSMKEAFLRDGGDFIKRHSNGVIAPSAAVMKHILAKLSLQRSSAEKGYSGNTGSDHYSA